VSRLVLVTPATGSPFEGRVISADETHAVLDVDGSETTVAYSDVSRAVVQVEFTRLEEAELDESDADPDADADGADPADTDPGDADHAPATDPEEG
jgi:ribosome maturation factor RimP